MTDPRIELLEAARALVPAALVTRDAPILELVCNTIAALGTATAAEVRDQAPLYRLRLAAALRCLKTAGRA